MSDLRICDDCGDPHSGRGRWCARCIGRHSSKCKQCGVMYDREFNRDICKSCRSQLPLIETGNDTTEPAC